MDTTAIIKIGAEAVEAFNGIIKRLPTREQRQLEKFYKFLEEYNKEVTREDSDFDDLLLNRTLKRLMCESFLSKITNPQKK